MASDDDSADKTMVIRPSAAGKRQPPPKARLTCVDVAVLKGGPGAEIRLDSVEITVGRASSNAVMLKADGISRVHARIFPGDGKWGIEDLKSTNGVRVNNSKIEQAWLEPGDTVAIGRVCYKYTLERDEKPAATPTQIDLGDYEKTVIMRPGARPAWVPVACSSSSVSKASQIRSRSAPNQALARDFRTSNSPLSVMAIRISRAARGHASAAIQTLDASPARAHCP